MNFTSPFTDKQEMVDSPDGTRYAVLTPEGLVSIGQRPSETSIERYYGPHQVTCLSFMDNDTLVIGLDSGMVEFFILSTRVPRRYILSRHPVTHILSMTPKPAPVPSVLIFTTTGYAQVWTKKHESFMRTDYLLMSDVAPRLTLLSSSGKIVQASDLYGHGLLRMWEAGAAKTEEYKVVETRVLGMTRLDIDEHGKLLTVHAEDGSNESWTWPDVKPVAISEM